MLLTTCWELICVVSVCYWDIPHLSQGCYTFRITPRQWHSLLDYHCLRIAYRQQSESPYLVNSRLISNFLSGFQCLVHYVLTCHSKCVNKPSAKLSLLLPRWVIAGLSFCKQLHLGMDSSFSIIKCIWYYLGSVNSDFMWLFVYF